MARRRQAVAGRGYRKRQRVEWGISKNTSENTVGANSVNVQTASTSLLLLLDQMTSPTIVRTRGEILLLSVGADNTVCLVGMGYAIVSSVAASVGPSAVPAPIAESDYSWLWHTFVHLKQQAVSDVNGATVSVARIVIDSRAMRKVLSTEEEPVFVVETQGTGNVSFMVSIRVLVKEV